MFQVIDLSDKDRCTVKKLSECEPISLDERKLSKFGQPKAAETKVPSVRLKLQTTPAPVNEVKVVLKKVMSNSSLKSSIDIPPPSDDDQGPVDFRKFLRKTKTPNSVE